MDMDRVMRERNAARWKLGDQVGSRKRLNPRFVEWLMGFSPGWTEIPGAKRTDRLRALGNAVVPAQAERAIQLLLAEQP